MIIGTEGMETRDVRRGQRWQYDTKLAIWDMV